MRSARAQLKGPQQLLSEHTQCLWSEHMPFTRADTATLNALQVREKKKSTYTYTYTSAVAQRALESNNSQQCACV
eukprot:8816388-Pyramimonas_sp.AAC.1